MRKAYTKKLSDDRETLWQFIERKASHRSSLGHQETARNYLSLCKSLSRYFGNDRPALYLEDIDEQFVGDYGLYLKRSGVCTSTISFYNRIFRSLYNQAVRDGLTKNAHPFDNAYTKVSAVRKYSKVMTSEGDVPLVSLSKEDIIRRYLLLLEKYNALVDRISELVKA